MSKYCFHDRGRESKCVCFGGCCGGQWEPSDHVTAPAEPCRVAPSHPKRPLRGRGYSTVPTHYSGFSCLPFNKHSTTWVQFRAAPLLTN